MLWLLKEPFQRDGAFEHPKRMFELMGIKENNYNCMLYFIKVQKVSVSMR